MLAALAPVHAASSTLTVSRLTTEKAVNPLGLDTPAPRLGWQIASPVRGTMQSAYQVQVARGEARLAAGKADLWDSGKVSSANSTHVAYAGLFLPARTRCWWRTRVWDSNGHVSGWSAPAFWEMGLLQAADRTAHWIGQAQFPTNYTLAVSFTLAHGGMGIFFRTQGTDAKNGYMWQVTNTSLREHTRHAGGYALLKTVPLAPMASAAAQGKPHVLRIVLNGSVIQTYLDDALVDTTTDMTYPTGSIGLREVATDAATFHKVTVTAPGGNVLFATDFAGNANPFNAGTLTPDGLSLTDADALLSSPPAAISAAAAPALPLLRRGFTLAKPVRSARLYASALGLYEIHLNGQKVGAHRFVPAWTDYHKRVQYQTYDVTGQLRAGANTLGALLGPGWYAGHLAWFPANEYGSHVALWAQLEIAYADGTHETIATDPSWRTANGPIISSDIIKGETYDARQERPGWDMSGVRDTDWKPAVLYDADAKGTLVAAVGPQVEVTGTFPALKMTQPKPGVYVYDIGQEVAGGVRIHLRGKSGDTVHIRYGEWLDTDGTAWTANLAGSDQPDVVTLKNGDTLWEPQFTYHGFRYVQVEDSPTPLALTDLSGLAMGTALPITGEITASNPSVGQLNQNIIWTGRNDAFSIPTDACARSERLGWTGDAQFYLPSALTVTNSQMFYEKWMTDLTDAQKPGGGFTNVAPSSFFGGTYGGGWGDVGVILPYVVWQRTGDPRIISDHYDAIKAWIPFMQAKSAGLIMPGSWAAPGDWLNAGENTPSDLIATAYFAYDTHLVAEMARLLGKTDEAAQFDTLFGQIRRAWQAKYVTASGMMSGNSQTGYVLALSMNLLPDEARAAAAQHLVDNITAHGMHLTTGFVGTPSLMPVLTDTGHTDVAYALLNQTTFPSWGYMLARGATTIWERWDVIQPDGTFAKKAHSFNHVPFGNVADWMYSVVGGIAPDPAFPGYAHSIVRPQPGGGLTWARASHDTAYGRQSVFWKTDSAGLHLDVMLPANTQATVYVPARSGSVMESGHPAAQASGVHFEREENGSAVYTVGSGEYHFTAPR